MRVGTVKAAFSAGVLLPAGLALNYLLTVVVARSLSVDDFGLFGFVQSLTVILALVGTLGFSQSTMRFTASYRATGQHARLAGLWRFSGSSVLAASTSIAGLLVLLAWLLPGHSAALLWTAALLVPFAVDAWRESAVRGLHRIAEAIAPRTVLLPLCFLLIFASVPIADANSALTLLVVTFLLIECVAVLLFLRQVHALTAGISPSYSQTEWMRVSLPMIGSALGSLSLTRSDVVIIGLVLGFEATGMYTAASRTALLVSLVLRAVSLVVGPKFAESYHSGDRARLKRQFAQATLLSGFLGLPFYLILMVVPNSILGFFGGEYTDAALLLQVLATGQFINLLTGPAALALNMTCFQRELAVLSLVAAALAVPLVAGGALVGGIFWAALAASGSVVLFNVGSLVLFVAKLTKSPT